MFTSLISASEERCTTKEVSLPKGEVVPLGGRLLEVGKFKTSVGGLKKPNKS